MTVTRLHTQAPVAPYPIDNSSVGPALRVRTIIDKTNDFVQAGARFRSFDQARQVRACART